jgi:hypothetical protein
MAYRIFAGCVAVVLLVMFLAPVVVKLKDVALGAVILIGFALMAWDLWESLRDKDE